MIALCRGRMSTQILIGFWAWVQQQPAKPLRVGPSMRSMVPSFSRCLSFSSICFRTWNGMRWWGCATNLIDSSTCMRTGSPFYSPIPLVRLGESSRKSGAPGGRLTALIRFNFWDVVQLSIEPLAMLAWSLSHRLSGSADMYGYTLTLGPGFRLSKSLLLRCSLCSRICHYADRCVRNPDLKDGFSVWGSCAPILNVYSSLLSSSAPAAVGVSPHEGSSMSTDLTLCLPFDGFLGWVGWVNLDRWLGLLRQTVEKIHFATV